MRGPIRAPILLHFGNCNTPAEPHRAVPWAAKPAFDAWSRSFHPRLALPAAPSLLCLNRPCLPGLPVPTQPDRAMPAAPYLTSPRNARSHRTCLSIPFTAEPCLPDHACRPAPSSIAPDLTTPCLPILSQPSLPRLTRPASTSPGLAQPSPPYLPCHSVPFTSPTTPSQPCLNYHRGHALPAVPGQPTLCLPELAWPCLPKPCLPRPPGLAVPTCPGHACRSDPRQCSGPCLQTLATPLVALPAVPFHVSRGATKRAATINTVAENHPIGLNQIKHAAHAVRSNSRAMAARLAVGSSILEFSSYTEKQLFR